MNRVKLSRLHLDPKLKWDVHIETMCKKMIGGVYNSLLLINTEHYELWHNFVLRLGALNQSCWTAEEGCVCHSYIIESMFYTKKSAFITIKFCNKLPQLRFRNLRNLIRMTFNMLFVTSTLHWNCSPDVSSKFHLAFPQVVESTCFENLWIENIRRRIFIQNS